MMVVGTERELSPMDGLQAELVHLAQIAAEVLNKHVNCEGLCVVCDSTFPCALAVLADYNMALV
jgi:hypothetical protein